MSSLVGVKVRSAISGCTACHSVIITADGKAMTFGKNLQICTGLFGRDKLQFLSPPILHILLQRGYSIPAVPVCMYMYVL